MGIKNFVIAGLTLACMFLIVFVLDFRMNSVNIQNQAAQLPNVIVNDYEYNRLNKQNNANVDSVYLNYLKTSDTFKNITVEQGSKDKTVETRIVVDGLLGIELELQMQVSEKAN